MRGTKSWKKMGKNKIEKNVCSIFKGLFSDRTPFYWRPIGKQSFYFPMHFTSDFLFFVLLSPPISGDSRTNFLKTGNPQSKINRFI